MKNGCRFHTLQSLMVLTSRDKIFGFKRKMPFWKTLCYKKETWNVSTAAGAPVKKIPASLKSHENHLGKPQNTLNSGSFPFKTSVSMNRFSFPESSDSEKLTWKKKKSKQQQSNTFKMSFTDLHGKVLDFCEEKNILLFIGNNEHYAAVSTSHTFEQSFIYSVNI